MHFVVTPRALAGNGQVSETTSADQGLPTVSSSKLDDATIEVRSTDDGDKNDATSREHSKQGLHALPGRPSSACSPVLGWLHACGLCRLRSSQPNSLPAARARPLWLTLANCILVALCLAGVGLAAHWATKSDGAPAADTRSMLADQGACVATRPQSPTDLYRNRTVCNQAAGTTGTLQVAGMAGSPDNSTGDVQVPSNKGMAGQALTTMLSNAASISTLADKMSAVLSYNHTLPLDGLARAIGNHGNNARLRRVIRDMMEGRRVSVGAIGGSNTWGMGADFDKGWFRVVSGPTRTAAVSA